MTKKYLIRNGVTILDVVTIGRVEYDEEESGRHTINVYDLKGEIILSTSYDESSVAQQELEDIESQMIKAGCKF